MSTKKNNIDIIEDDLSKLCKGEVLNELLTDHTKRQELRKQEGHKDDYAFIIWATSDYEAKGEEYAFAKEIRPELITGENKTLIMPRVLKDREAQIIRSKEKAEVFTPSWVCNAQNNLIDEAWFGRRNVFNREITNEDGSHSWETTEDTISFEGTGKTWIDYIFDTRLEITCGEGPYLVSRYDTTTGIPIPLRQRIGLLDRKMRVINEHVTTVAEWNLYAKIAFCNIYGFEWQGDNLLLAREALFVSALEYFEDFQVRQGIEPKQMHSKTMKAFAHIISWNLWQMDGLKFVIPETCHAFEKVTKEEANFFFEPVETREVCECPGCKSGDNSLHNGIYAKIRDWGIKKDDYQKAKGKIKMNWKDMPFYDLVKNI